MIRSLLYFSVMCLPMMAAAQEVSRVDQARLTVGVPTYVTHPDDRPGGRDWNEGWLNNEGVLIDASWPVRKLGEDTNLRLGATAGGFDNSEHKASFFLGGMAEVETFVTDVWAMSLGTYVGAITGYENSLSPAIAPYVGSSYAVTERLEVGLRGFWLPGKTFAGSNNVASDAYIGVVTLGTRF